jgi:hypothetical protein
MKQIRYLRLNGQFGSGRIESLQRKMIAQILSGHQWTVAEATRTD